MKDEYLERLTLTGNIYGKRNSPKLRVNYPTSLCKTKTENNNKETKTVRDTEE